MKKHHLIILLAGLLLTGCKKDSHDVDPKDPNETGLPAKEEPDNDESDGFIVFDGLKYDNQRVSIPDDLSIVFNNRLFVNRIDTLFVLDSTYTLSWSILVPEEQSVSADWTIDYGIPITTVEKKYWYQDQRVWRYVFQAKLDNAPLSGSGILKIVMKNESTGESISRGFDIDVRVETIENDYNWVDFGMPKDKVKELEALRYNFLTHYRDHPWKEILPTVGVLPAAKYFNGGQTAYEFVDGRLSSISEFIPGITNWYNNGPREPISQILNTLHIKGWPRYQYDDQSGRYTLLEPYSWVYNGLKITLSTDKEFHLNGEPAKCTSLTFEKAE